MTSRDGSLLSEGVWKQPIVSPAKAGVHCLHTWIPAFAGMTVMGAGMTVGDGFCYGKRHCICPTQPVSVDRQVSIGGIL